MTYLLWSERTLFGVFQHVPTGNSSSDYQHINITTALMEDVDYQELKVLSWYGHSYRTPTWVTPWGGICSVWFRWLHTFVTKTLVCLTYISSLVGACLDESSSTPSTWRGIPWIGPEIIFTSNSRRPSRPNNNRQDLHGWPQSASWDGTVAYGYINQYKFKHRKS